MSDSTKKSGDGRQITYRVGWKSGTIHLEDKKPPNGGTLADFAEGKTASGAAKPGAPAGRMPYAPPAASTRRIPSPLWMRAADALLRPAPLPTLRAWTIVLFALPPAAFAALCWLAIRLSAAA
ncbi:hypothetical protein MO973_11900 [Paenibacillus sp. TRM 82003]|nr:hypothetical protein [Paenibacillus sp. TRM 82003]